MFRLTPVVQTLLLINIAMLAVPLLVGTHAEMVTLLALRFFNSPLFSIYQLVTYMFMHANFWHLLFNMMGLVFFGAMLEQVWGAQKFLVFYMVCGIGAGLLYLGVNFFQLSQMHSDMEAFLANPTPAELADFLKRYQADLYRESLDVVNAYSRDRNNPEYIRVARRTVEAIYLSHLNAPMVGASGAVYGVLLAFGMLFPNMSLVLFPLPIPVKAKYMVMVYGVMALYGVFQNAPGDRVAHLAHLGGMVVGLILLFVWSKGKRPEQYY